MNPRPNPAREPVLPLLAIAAALIVMLAAGCSSTRPLFGTMPDNLRSLPRDKVVQLQLAGGEAIEVSHVTVVGDSVEARITTYRRDRSFGQGPDIRTVTYALSDVQGVHDVRPDPGKTALAVGVGVVITVAVAGLLVMASMGP